MYRIPQNNRLFSKEAKQVADQLVRRSVVPFIYDLRLYYADPEKLPKLYYASVTLNASDQRLLFGRYNIQHLHLVAPKYLPHARRIPVPVHWREHITLWLSMVMSRRRRAYSQETLEMLVSKFFGPLYKDEVHGCLLRFAKEGLVQQESGRFTGVPLYTYTDTHSGIHPHEGGYLFKRHAHD